MHSQLPLILVYQEDFFDIFTIYSGKKKKAIHLIAYIRAVVVSSQHIFPQHERAE